ncbi:MAG: hypothetical protein IJN50_01465 [Clostridia bacterium]|nr:hypothetical protein [Clostridia bacterium]
MEKYERRHISESLLTLSGQIHPAYCVGRKAENLNDTTKETFAYAFFANATSEELNSLWAFAEKESEHGELFLSFAVKESSVSRTLTAEEMKTFDFSKYSWEIHPLAPTEDELREIPQAICGIIFYAK